MTILRYRTLLILLLLAIPLVSFSQIPNPGFEQWSAGNPDSWFALNLIGFGIPVTQSTPGHSGSWALKGQVITSTLGDTMLPLLVSGQSGQGFPVFEKHGALTGYYKFSAAAGDQFVITVLMYNSNNYLGGGLVFIAVAASNFTLFTIPINYISSEIPDQCIIQISIGNPSSIIHPGSYYIVDDLSLSAETDINDEPVSGLPVDFELLQNYPNPFNPETYIRYAIPKTDMVKLEVYNSLGQKVMDLVNEFKPAGYYEISFDASHLSSGIYYYQIQAGSYQKVMKMMLMK